MKKYLLLVTSITALSLLPGCISKQEKAETQMKDFISAYETKVIPLYKEYALA